jgi:Mg-chelatase subunit ChlD
MGSSCAGQTDGRTEYVENGFSLLDLVRHALKTVIQTLRPQDRLSIITFNNNAQTRIQIQNMSEEGKKLAYACAESISHGGGTNMQKAITYSVLEVLNREDKSRNPSILFFTDGQSQVNLEEFQNLKDQSNLSCPVHTFGFGQYTSLNSSVLYNIARIFSGYNAYIPDPTNLGTAFVNGVANILTTAALEVKLNFGNKNS